MKGNLSDVGCHENSKLPTVHNILARFPKSAIPAYKFPPDVCSDAAKEHGRSACFVSLFENRGGRQKEPLLSSWYSQLMAKSLKKVWQSALSRTAYQWKRRCKSFSCFTDMFSLR